MDATATFLNELSPKQLDQLKKMLDVRADEEANAPADKPLKEPIPFYSPKDRWLRFYVKGRTKPCKFINGEFYAKTELEAEALRMKKGVIFEGRDRPLHDPLIDSETKEKFWNSKAFQFHMNRK